MRRSPTPRETPLPTRQYACWSSSEVISIRPSMRSTSPPARRTRRRRRIPPVERHVASSETHQREPSFGGGEHGPPGFERGMEAALERLVRERRGAGVRARVVDHVGAATQEHGRRPGPAAGQPVDDEVEEEAPPGRHDRLARERTLLEQAHRQATKVVEERLHLTEARRRSIVRDRPFVAGDPGEIEQLRAFDGVGHLDRLRQAPASRSTRPVTQLDEDRERPILAGVADPLFEEGDPTGRIDQAHELGRLLRDVRGGPPERPRVGELVREQHPSHPGRPQHPRLRGPRGAHPPAARVELLPPELGSHGRLGVRRDRHPMLPAVPGHQPDVVLERRPTQHEDRWDEVRERPPLVPRLEQRDGLRDRGESLGRGPDPDLGQQRLGPGRAGHERKRGR